MQHTVQFQYRPTPESRPYDYGQAFRMNSDDGALLLPNVGDHVQIDKDFGDGTTIVENRLFRYVSVGEKTICAINIVLIDAATDPGLLVKE